MHTFEFQRSIKQFFSELEGFRPFTSALSVLAHSTDSMDIHLSGIAKGGDRLAQSAHHIHVHLAHAQQTTSTINNRQFFKALEHFQGSIERLKPRDTTKAELISNLNTKVEEFATLYDVFLSNQNAENALPLLLAAKVLHIKIETLFDSLQLVEESICAYDVPGNTEAPLTLLLPAHLNLTEFAQRLFAIQTIYSELCMLLSVSESTYPLRISKIESGSLWAKVFGESRVVGMMVSFVEQTASWLYRSYTVEGKVASIPRKVEAIDSLLGLTERLSEAGINTSEMKDHIEKSAVAISKSLAEILDGQSSITVNDQTISVSSEISKELLERTPPRQLTNSEPPTVPPLN